MEILKLIERLTIIYIYNAYSLYMKRIFRTYIGYLYKYTGRDIFMYNIKAIKKLHGPDSVL